jgi:hypothetical protein
VVVVGNIEETVFIDTLHDRYKSSPHSLVEQAGVGIENVVRFSQLGIEKHDHRKKNRLVHQKYEGRLCPTQGERSMKRGNNVSHRRPQKRFLAQVTDVERPRMKGMGEQMTPA